jgi:hypothetical protein
MADNEDESDVEFDDLEHQVRFLSLKVSQY